MEKITLIRQCQCDCWKSNASASRVFQQERIELKQFRGKELIHPRRPARISAMTSFCPRVWRIERLPARLLICVLWPKLRSHFRCFHHFGVCFIFLTFFCFLNFFDNFFQFVGFVHRLFNSLNSRDFFEFAASLIMAGFCNSSSAVVFFSNYF